MLESDYRKKVVQILREYDPIPVENSLNVGTPDVNFTLGWLELKIGHYSVRPPHRLLIPHLTPQQKAWLVRREQKNGLALLLVSVAHDQHFLFNALQSLTAHDMLDEELFARSNGRFKNVQEIFDDEFTLEKELPKCVMQIYNRMNSSTSTVREDPLPSRKMPNTWVPPSTNTGSGKRTPKPHPTKF